MIGHLAHIAAGSFKDRLSSISGAGVLLVIVLVCVGIAVLSYIGDDDDRNGPRAA